MKYHTISTSKTGHGAIFTNLKEAREYQKNHPNSVYHAFDQMPTKIPSVGETTIVEPPKTLAIPKGPCDSISAYTDGSALNNPGPGGWGLIIQMEDGNIQEHSQGYKHTTNNRMEMMAVIRALCFAAQGIVFKPGAMAVGVNHFDYPSAKIVHRHGPVAIGIDDGRLPVHGIIFK